APAVVVARGSVVNATLGTGTAASAVGRQAQTVPPVAAAAPTLARTGGVALAGLALWLLIGGLMSRLAASERLWRLARGLRGLRPRDSGRKSAPGCSRSGRGGIV